MFLIKVHASPERVYQAVMTADDIRQWWTRDAAIEPKVGGTGEFGFYARRFVAKVTVEELNPASRVRWEVANAAWQGNDIEFNVRADGDDTTLVFAHRGFPRADARPSAFALSPRIIIAGCPQVHKNYIVYVLFLRGEAYYGGYQLRGRRTDG